MTNKKREFEIDIRVKMSQKVLILLTIGGWLWGFVSSLYFSYVALTGENPIIDVTLGLPSYITYLFGVVGVWGIVWACIIGWIILMVIGVLIVKFRR